MPTPSTTPIEASIRCTRAVQRCPVTLLQRRSRFHHLDQPQKSRTRNPRWQPGLPLTARIRVIFSILKQLHRIRLQRHQLRIQCDAACAASAAYPFFYSRHDVGDKVKRTITAGGKAGVFVGSHSSLGVNNGRRKTRIAPAGSPCGRRS
jgi:hypothetical protein